MKEWFSHCSYLVTTFKIVPRGTEGAVSIEGTFAGILASVLLASVSVLMGQVKITCFLCKSSSREIYLLVTVLSESCACNSLWIEYMFEFKRWKNWWVYYTRYMSLKKGLRCLNLALVIPVGWNICVLI